MDNNGKNKELDIFAEFDKLKEKFGKSVPEEVAEEEKVIHIVPEYEPIGLDHTIVADKPISEQLEADAPAERHEAPAAITAVPLVRPAENTGLTEDSKGKMGRSKKTKEKKNNGKKKYRFNFWKFFRLLLILGLLCVIAVGIIVGKIIKETPEINPNNIYEMLSENSIMYDRNGEVIENVYQGNSLRTNLEYNEIPKDLINAFVSIEDKTFWDHHGFNFVRIIGAIVQKVTGQSDRIGGTSTITQQLARNLYLAETKSERDMTRKIREAYYTIVLERALSKEQIIEAYLNTIYLGYNCDGVAAAAQAYFSKDVQELNLMECALLASLPQSPNNYSPLKRRATAEIQDFDSLDIITKDENWTTYYNNKGENRLQLVLRFMHDQEKISDATYESLKGTTIRDYINPGNSAVSTATTSYFSDYVKSAVLKDLQSELNLSYDDAYQLLYSGGLRINTTMDMQIQHIIEDVYSKPENFPPLGKYARDSQGNILDANDKVLLYSVPTFFTEDGDFLLGADEFEWMPTGALKIFGGKRMNFYRTSVGGTIDYSAEFKNLYEIVDGVFYIRSGGVFNIPAEYKDRTTDGDLVIKANYFTEKPEAFTKQEDGTLLVSQKYFTLKQRVRQPQSAFVIKDYKTGALLGMIGGRDIDGKLLYNRANSTRQPGSSIKPLAIYSVALQKGVEMGGTFTAAMPLDDVPINYGGALWPSNWYSGYKGMTNLRHAVEQSINACAVQLYTQMQDPDKSIEFLQGMGVTSLVTEGEVNDINASALALGGMTKGISPIEMCGAYGTIGNYGTYVETICYTTVTTKNGDIVLEKTPYEHQVMDEAVASLMTNILRSTVTNGLGSGARLNSQPSAGKTGTTSERYDIWFCGITPQYAASCWIGNDVNIDLGSDSSGATKVWRLVMEQVGALVDKEEFVMKGDFVTCTVDRHSGKLLGEFSTDECALTETFIAGTQPTEYDDSHVFVSCCAETGYLATPLCPETVSRYGRLRPGNTSWEGTLSSFLLHDYIDGKGSATLTAIPDADQDVPTTYCPFHNPDPEQYPVSRYAEENAKPVYDESAFFEGELDPEVDDFYEEEDDGI